MDATADAFVAETDRQRQTDRDRQDRQTDRPTDRPTDRQPASQAAMWGGDVSTAFPQGVPEERSQPLFMKAPRDGIQRLAGTFPSTLYKITGNL